MPTSKQMKVRFEKAAGLGAFCQALRDHEMSYLLAGGNIVVVNTKDLARLRDMKLGVFKDHKPAIEPVVPFHALSPEAKAAVVRNRLLPRAQLLENLRKPLKDIS